MLKPLMPKATAVWLTDNTTLTFLQIADFVGLHELEVQAIADGEVAPGMQGLDALASGQLTVEEIARCAADPNARLVLAESDIPRPVARPRGARYTPVAKRADKPDGIEWLLKNHAELSDAQIGRLLGTTKPTIQAIRDRTHWNAQQLKARSPVELGLCSLGELDVAVSKARSAAERVAERLRKAEARAGGDESAPEAEADAVATEADAAAVETEAEVPIAAADGSASGSSEPPAEPSEPPKVEPAI